MNKKDHFPMNEMDLKGDDNPDYYLVLYARS